MWSENGIDSIERQKLHSLDKSKIQLYGVNKKLILNIKSQVKAKKTGKDKRKY